MRRQASLGGALCECSESLTKAEYGTELLRLLTPDNT
jgi:hypothetical protein